MVVKGLRVFYFLDSRGLYWWFYEAVFVSCAGGQANDR